MNNKQILISPITIEAMKIAIIDIDEVIRRIKQELAESPDKCKGVVLEIINDALEMREQSSAIFANIISRYEANHDQRQS